MKTKPKEEDLSDIFTKTGIAKLKVGQLLRFDFEGTINEYKITTMNRKSGKVFATPITTYLPDETVVKDITGESETFDEYREGEIIDV